jgi:hypothetical protein
MPVIALDDSNPMAPAGDLSPLQTFTEQLYFAHFAEGSGLLFSRFLLINPGPAAAQGRIEIRDNNGDPLMVDLGGSQINGVLDIEIPGSGLLAVGTDGEGDPVSGSATVGSEQEWGGVILFGGLTGLAGVGNSPEIAATFLAPMERNEEESINTGIAVSNLESSGIDLEIELLDTEGAVRAEAQESLAAFGHLAQYVDQFSWTPSAVDLADFVGVMRVSSNGKVAATVLQSRLDRQLATMPTAEQ